MAMATEHLLYRGASEMGRVGAPRTRMGMRRDNALTATLVETVPSARLSSTPWVARNWRLLVTVVATMATMPCFLGRANMSRSGAIRRPSVVGHQSLFATPESRGGISIARQPAGWSTSRLLQEETRITAPVEYETKLQLFMCNPTLDEGNDAYLVDEESLGEALSKVGGLLQPDATKITVVISTEPADDDRKYMCDVDGMLQWYAQIAYSLDDAESAGTTPALMAAQANDHVAYYSDDFKTVLAANINNEHAGDVDNVELSAADIVIPTVGWIVTFPAEEPTAQEAVAAGSSDGLAIGLTSNSGMWVWWVWLLYLLLVACCLVPLCCFLRKRRKDDKNAPGQRIHAVREGRSAEGLSKIRGPEWGITELDFEGDHKKYQNQEMKREYDGASKGVKPTTYKKSHRQGQQSVSAQAWMQESPVRRFDIDDDHDGGVAQLRSKHPQYSFDVGRGGFGGGESKS